MQLYRKSIKHRNGRLGDLPVHVSNINKWSNMNRERLGSTHLICSEITLSSGSNCKSQMAQIIYGNVELGVVHLWYESPNDKGTFKCVSFSM